MLPTGASSKSPNRAPEQYNTMGGSLEHAEHNQGLHEEENVNTGSASGLQVENAPVSSSSLSLHLCRVLIIKSRPIHLHVVSIVRLGSFFLYLYPSLKVLLIAVVCWIRMFKSMIKLTICVCVRVLVPLRLL